MPLVLAVADVGGAPGADLLSQLLGYGVIGLVLVMILVRWLVPGWVVTRQDAAHTAEIAALQQAIAQQDGEIAALRAGLDTTSAFVRDQVVPALTRSADALRQANELAREHLAELTRRAGSL